MSTQDREPGAVPPHPAEHSMHSAAAGAHYSFFLPLRGEIRGCAFVNAAQRTNIACAAGLWIFLGVDLRMTAGKIGNDAYKSIKPRCDERFPRVISIDVAGFRKPLYV